jgi:epoxyqueuosine reductase
MRKNRKNSGLCSRLLEVSKRCGAHLFGVADASEFSGYEGKHSPFHYEPMARSVIVIGYHLDNPVLDAWVPDGRGKDRAYSFVNEILGNIGFELASVLLKGGNNAILTPYSGVFSKDAAALAHLGTIGKNNLLLTDRFGPRVRLRTIVTDAELPKTPDRRKGFCDDCPRLCWSACPAGAFSEGRFNRGPCEEYGCRHTKKLGENSYLYCRECEITCPVGRPSGTEGRMVTW